MSKTSKNGDVVTKPVPTSLTESANPKINTAPIKSVTTFEKNTGNNKK